MLGLFADGDGYKYYQAGEGDVPDAGFDSGIKEFTDYYRTHSLQDMRERLVRMYLVKRNGRVLGYVALAMSRIRHDATPEIEKKEINGNVPALVISHLAVHKDFQRKGIVFKLRDLVFDIVPKLEPWAGCRYVMLNPRDDQGVRDFYAEYGFEYKPNFRDECVHNACLMDLKSAKW